MEEIKAFNDDLNQHPDNEASIKGALSGMATAFQGRSCLSEWDDEVLGKIDQCFIKHFYNADGPCLFLYFPESADYLNSFDKYCSDVDRVFQTNVNTSPPFARAYFAYSMMWKIHGHKFPMPLGTASAVSAVDSLATKVHGGLSEVSNSSLVLHTYLARKHSDSNSSYIPRLGSSPRRGNPGSMNGLHTLGISKIYILTYILSSGSIMDGDMCLLGTPPQLENVYYL